MKHILIIIISTFAIFACTPKIDRQSRKYYRKEIRDKEVIFYANRESGFSSQLDFTLRNNRYYAFTYQYFGKETVMVGTWTINNENDTIYLKPYLEHKLADFAHLINGQIDFYFNNQKRNNLTLKVIESKL